MPYFDGTGPYGAGPMTGRGMGPCGDWGYQCPYWRSGWGKGMGRGRPGYWNRSMSKTEELSSLTKEEKILQEELEMIKKEIEYLKGKAK